MRAWWVGEGSERAGHRQLPNSEARETRTLLGPGSPAMAVTGKETQAAKGHPSVYASCPFVPRSLLHTGNQPPWLGSQLGPLAGDLT